MRHRTSIRVHPVALGALIGGTAAFVAAGGLSVALSLAAGALLGAALGLAVHRVAGRAQAFEEAVELRDAATRDELYEQARELGIQGRSTMTKDELVAAITDAQH